MNIKIGKGILTLLLCVAILLCNIPVACIAVGEATESTNANLIDSKASNLTTDASRYYYNQLNSQEKCIYDTFLNQIYGDPEVHIAGLDSFPEQESNYIDRALRALNADYPIYSLYWGEGGIISSTDPLIFSRDQVTVPDWLLCTVQARIDQYVASIDPTADRYSQLYELYLIMYNEIYYDGFYTLIGHGVSNIHSVYGCLGYGLAVCDGFALSTKIICDRLNIPCLYVAGHQPGNSDGHAWNYIQMEDGQWYNFDTSSRFGIPTYILGGKDSVLTEESFENGPMHDFVLPDCPEQPYRYTGTITDDSYVLAPNAFLDAPGTFVYEVNEDGETCTITDFYGSQQGDLRIPEQIDGYIVTEIGSMAFYGRIHFTGDIIIPDAVTTIGDSAFRQCYGISGTLTLPKQLVNIGSLAFMGNSNMTGTLDLPDTLRSLGRLAFHYCKGLTGSVVLPEGLKEVDYPFQDCSGFDGILHIPDSLENIKGIFTGTNFKSIHVNDTNPNYSVYDGVLYSKDMRTMIACPVGKQGSLVIPEGVVRVAESACNGCTGLTGHLVLPKSLQVIGPWAFALTSFDGDLIIPDSVTEIGPAAFLQTGFGGKLKLPSELERIEDSVFMGCGFTGTLKLPNSVTYIGGMAFYHNSFVGTLIIPEKVTYVGEWLACGWYSQESIFRCEFKGDAPYIHEQAFYGYHTTVVYPQNASRWTEIINNDYWVPEPITWLAVCNNHDLLEWETDQAPTCVVDGTKRRDCSHCDYFETVTDPGSATGHSYNAVVTASTCTVQGYTTYTCNCGDSYVGDYTAKLPHEMGDWAWVSEPTCTEGGEEIRYCNNCTLSETRDVGPLGHDYSHGVCTRCGIEDPDYTGLPGDLNDDGEVTDADAIYLLYATFDPDSYPLYGNADYNGDGEVTDADAIYLLYATFDPDGYPLS